MVVSKDRPAQPRAVAAWLRASPVLFVLIAAAAGAQSNPDREMPSLAPMIEQVSPAVVNISVSGSVAISSPLADDEFLRRFFQIPPDARREFQSAGSGVIVDAEKGYIVTNHHVVENADRINVRLLDKREMDARVVGSDAGSDLAVLQVDARDLGEIRLGTSSTLRVGDYVVAIGNPFGLSHTVTSGIVSSLSRYNINPSENAYEDFIQTDASINPGNSGGALVNLNGELVGINSVILSRTGGNIGIGFAIPVDMARGIMEQLIEFGAVSRGRLGVRIADLTPEHAELYSVRDAAGALVTSVEPDSTAEKAGIEINDVIVSVNGGRVRDAGSLRNTIGLLRPGSTVRVGLVRDGREQTVDAVLGAAPSGETTAVQPEPESDLLDPVFEGAEIVENEGGALAGLRVVRVAPGSPAFQGGLRAGDVITYVNKVRVRSLEDARELIGNARSLVLQVQRGNRSQVLLLR